jgi:hypothetical protein
MKKLSLLHFPPSSFAGTGSTKRTSVCMNQEHAPKCTLKPSTRRNRANGANHRMVRAPPAPNRLTPGHMRARDRAHGKRWLKPLQLPPAPGHGHMVNNKIRGLYQTPCPTVATI